MVIENKYQFDVLRKEDFDNYNDFLKNNLKSHFGHSLEARELICKYFKFIPNYVVAKDVNGKIVGSLPLFEARSFIEGNRMVSIPFFPYGGVIAINEECEKKILEFAINLTNKNKCKFLQIREKNLVKGLVYDDFLVQTSIINFILDLKSNEEEMFNSLDKRVRYDIRKSRKYGLRVEIGKSKNLLDDFYEVYLNTRKKRGLPSWDYNLFLDALEKWNTRVAITYDNDKPIAGCFLFMEKDIIEYAFAGADYKFNYKCPYYSLIWEIISYGIKNNYKVLEFGGSNKQMNEGKIYSFKDRWCSEKHSVAYYFYANDDKDIPIMEESFGLYKLYGFVWSKLPKKVIRFISPYVLREFS